MGFMAYDHNASGIICSPKSLASNYAAEVGNNYMGRL